MNRTIAPDSSPLTRRQVLAASAAAAAACFVPRDSVAAEESKIKEPYIDAHSHVWSPDTDKWPLAKGKTRADLAPTSFTPEELLAVAQPEGVGRVVLIQHHIYHGWDNRYLIDCAARFPGRFVVVGMVDDTTPHPDVTMKELLPQKVRGLRITSWIRGKEWLEGPGMAAMWKCGAETGQAMCCLINPEDLAGVDAMCKKNPETPVVIDHFARIGVDGTIRDSDVDALCKLARHKHVHAKLSAYYALGKKKPPYEDLAPMVGRVLGAFGADRCMWASDSPYQLGGDNTYKASISLVRDRLKLSDGDRQWLLAGTAEKVYFA